MNAIKRADIEVVVREDDMEGPEHTINLSVAAQHLHHARRVALEAIWSKGWLASQFLRIERMKNR